MITDKLYWVYSSDGTIVYVKRAYYTKFMKMLMQQTVTSFYTSEFEDAVLIAEDFIKRTEAKEDKSE